MEAWAVSEAGCQSDTASEDAKVDIDGPAVTITDSVVDANGDVTINFQAIDLISGVDTDRVLVNGNAVSVTDTDGVAKEASRQMAVQLTRLLLMIMQATSPQR